MMMLQENSDVGNMLDDVVFACIADWKKATYMNLRDRSAHASAAVVLLVSEPRGL